jgi:hypothetical protein
MPMSAHGRIASRLRRSSSASLQTAAAKAATSNPARRRLSNRSVCLSAVRIARFPRDGPGVAEIFFYRKARPDGFEPPTTWFEAGDARVKKSQFFQRLTDTPLCY